MGFVFLISLILILYIILLFNFFETSKKITAMTEQIEELKKKAEIPTVNLSPSEALDALKAEIEARQKKKEEEEAADEARKAKGAEAPTSEESTVTSPDMGE